ncbi:MAG TPA: hypothetical protein VIG51_02985 [Candidatus Baltobacteraceae bacterium]|jgi:hypothetical protein
MRFRTGILSIVLAVAGTALCAAAAPPPQLPPQPAVRPAWVPKGALLVSPCIAGMGSHWANPKNLPFGPIYGEYQGKPVFSEIMIDQKAFAKGTNWREQLQPLAGYKIDHVDIEFNPYGHAGYPIPHYDIHAYYVSHAVHTKFCPNGEKIRGSE